MKRSEVIDGLRYIKNWKCDGDAEMYEVIVSAIKMSEQPEIVRCGECVNFAERDFCKVAGHNVHRKSNCMQVFGAERRTYD